MENAIRKRKYILSGSIRVSKLFMGSQFGWISEVTDRLLYILNMIWILMNFIKDVHYMNKRYFNFFYYLSCCHYCHIYNCQCTLYWKCLFIMFILQNVWKSYVIYYHCFLVTTVINMWILKSDFFLYHLQMNKLELEGV